MSCRTKGKSDAGGRRTSGAIAGYRALYGKGKATGNGWQSPTLPRNWRDRLPDPDDYYREQVPKLSKPNAAGWAQGACPFHEDRNASLSAHVSNPRGCWRCFAGCGGGDLVSFHMRLTDKSFKEAIVDLAAGRA
ncbi:hypothetical protein JI752_009635 [Lysobacter sp. MMG2]|uniref:CHC2 zinc finger domain-containing protein n=1 Tax=Lysobacter sp. MMG2 TaxID=2801338 RepID=UPI001C23C3F3|nr:CHC2 zinc finger domain-containing protein [Lysobacter sp. MMG2]MBU8976398.1 hypothetical protein [Lysobacter sp. MMG2]